MLWNSYVKSVNFSDDLASKSDKLWAFEIPPPNTSKLSPGDIPQWQIACLARAKSWAQNSSSEKEKKLLNW